MKPSDLMGYLASARARLALALAGCLLMACGSEAVEPQGARRSAVVYGSDDRRDVYQLTDTELRQAVLGATVAIVPASRLDERDPDRPRLVGETLEDVGVCPDQAYAEQLTAADCSGTLIAPDLVLTAGHCLGALSQCDEARIVFDYYMEDAERLHEITGDDVYRCVDIVLRRGGLVGSDHTIVRLDRPAVGRLPATTHPEPHPIAEGDEVWIAGFPSGLPLKVASNARVRSTGQHGFIANLDSFAGNSGSGVHLASTGELVGVLSFGETDYVERNHCLVVNECSDDGCLGESASYAHVAVNDLCALGEGPEGCTCGDGICEASESSESCCRDCRCAADGNCRLSRCKGRADQCPEGLERLPAEDGTLIQSVTGLPTRLRGACSAGDGPDVGYRVSVTEPVRMNAAAGGFDTVLYLLEERHCPDGIQVVCNDDVNLERGNLGSSISVDLDPGEYVLMVDSYDADPRGGFLLEWNFDGPRLVPHPTRVYPDGSAQNGGCGCRARDVSSAPTLASLSLASVVIGLVARRRRGRSKNRVGNAAE